MTILSTSLTQCYSDLKGLRHRHAEASAPREVDRDGYSSPLGIQIAQCRQFLQILGPNVGIIYIHGSLGVVRKRICYDLFCYVESSKGDSLTEVVKAHHLDLGFLK